MKSAFVELIGRPSTGKSSLINRVCGHKVSIVSSVPQTTRNKIRGVYTEKRGQLVFVDTPGFHSSRQKFNLYLKQLALAELNEVDLVLYLVDVSREAGDEEHALIALLSGFKQRLVIGLNKTDLPHNHIGSLSALLRDELAGVPLAELSCATGSGVDNLITILFDMAPQGEPFYPPDFYTDQTPEFRIAEIIREKVILNTRQELPHTVYIEIADMEPAGEQDLLWVRGFICVEKDSQKGIVIGHKGGMIKKIMQEAAADLGPLFPYRLDLDFRVKVRAKWKTNDVLLKKLIT
jgi:GTP-binding protein Era